jgi:hypothetical protein
MIKGAPEGVERSTVSELCERMPEREALVRLLRDADRRA